MRTVVTGGAGFIGSHLIEALLRRGDDVVCIERPNASRGWLEDAPVPLHAVGVSDARTLAPLLDGADVVFHLAGLTEARTPADYYAVNTEGTGRVLEAAGTLGASAPRVLLMSSIAATGPCRNGDALNSDTVPFPLSHYGHSKLLAEAIAHAWADRVPVTILRFPSVYGPRERAVLTLFKLVKRGIALTVGAWEREFSLIFVQDAVQALLLAADESRQRSGQIYCIAHPQPVTWRQFAQEVGRAVHRSPRLVSVPVPVARAVAVAAEAVARVRRSAAVLNRERVREITQPRWVCDPARAVDRLGFHADFGIERGVPETANWYEEARWM
jgi:nucleoside-diphosphate-sugar epimerase